MSLKYVLLCLILLAIPAFVMQSALLPRLLNSSKFVENVLDNKENHMHFDPDDYEIPPTDNLIIESPQDGAEYKIGEVIRCFALVPVNDYDEGASRMIWYVGIKNPGIDPYLDRQGDQVIGMGNRVDTPLGYGTYIITAKYGNRTTGAFAEKSVTIHVR